MPRSQFRLEEIVHPDVRDVAKEFECPICISIFDEPVQAPCSHIFCRECVERCAICPVCREPLPPDHFKELAKHNKPMMRLMHCLKVCCPHGIERPTALSGTAQTAEVTRLSKRPRRSTKHKCGWSGTYGDLLSKHLGQCPFRVVPCPQGCGESLQWLDLEKHQSVCERGFETCSICKAKVQRGHMDAHRAEAAQVHVQMLEERVIDMEAERVDVAGRLARLELKMHFLAKGSQVTGVAKACQIDAAFRDAVAWKFRNVMILLHSCVRGEAVLSQEFSLRGIDGFRLRYAPRGDSRSPDGKAALWVEGPSTVSWTIRLSVDGRARLVDSEDAQREGGPVGLIDFWSCPEPTAKSVMIKAKLLDIAHFVDVPSSSESGDEASGQ